MWSIITVEITSIALARFIKFKSGLMAAWIYTAQTAALKQGSNINECQEKRTTCYRLFNCQIMQLGMNTHLKQLQFSYLAWRNIFFHFTICWHVPDMVSHSTALQIAIRLMFLMFSLSFHVFELTISILSSGMCTYMAKSARKKGEMKKITVTLMCI